MNLLSHPRRSRSAKIVATLGPSSSDRDTIKALFDAGVDVFRFNLSHGDHATHQARYEAVRSVEAEVGRPIGVLLDLQGPKIRIGRFAEGRVELRRGDRFQIDLDASPGDANRVGMPHPEVFSALKAGSDLLLDDGRIRLRVLGCEEGTAQTEVLHGGVLSDRKGVNVPSVLLPISAMTDKDREDLEFGLRLGVDWIALSFVQRAEDVAEVQRIAGSRALVLAKLEKPAAIAALDEIIRQADAVMVARGDLGVEMPAEQVPRLQKQIVRRCRAAGKPVIVATQMLESMVSASVPTRAEASDVATAVYEGADAVMLSAESASGQFPVEAVSVMNRIIQEVESDPQHRMALAASHTPSCGEVADAVCASLREAVNHLPAKAIVSYTRSGYSSLRAARERPSLPIVCMTPELSTARRMVLGWGIHCVHAPVPIADVPDMVESACALARAEGLAVAGDHVLVTAGMPFGMAGTTNFLHIAKA